jgi:hypothetical protein
MSTLAPPFETRFVGATESEAAGVSPSPRGGSAVSWPAVIAGAFVAAATSVILLALGSGLGFAVASPWANHGTSAASFTAATAIWLLVTQWVSAWFGGYLAGRLRRRWVGTHVHEVFFRDTAHGLITWSVATVLIAAVLANSAAAMLGGGVRALGQAASDVAADAASNARNEVPGTGEDRGSGAIDVAYGIDTLFRSAIPDARQQNDTNARQEAGRIVAHAIRTGNITDVDRSYLAMLIAEHTGVGPAEAQKRVDDLAAARMNAENAARAAADEARKAAAEASLYLALSLLVGAFIASVAAALGGRERDRGP